MTPEQFQKYFASLNKKFDKALNQDIPKKIGNEAVRLFKKNFQNEGFFSKKWEEVQRRKTKTITYKTKTGKIKTKEVSIGKGAAGSRKILTGATGDLGRSIKYKVEPGCVVVYSDLKYSKVHNEGGRAGRGKGFKMPKRQFIGEHEELTKAINETIEKEIQDIFKSK